jgi:hypothetical protein
MAPMYLSQKHMSRRTMLRGMGVTVALPLLDAMVPAQRLLAKSAAVTRPRLIAIEMVHGAAGSTEIGIQKHLWAPAGVGRDFDLGPTCLTSLEPYRDYLTIVSNTDVRNAEAFESPRGRRRSLPVERGLPHADASATDRGLGRARGHVVRPALRAALRPGHAHPLDAALHRERRPVGRLRLRLCVRLHRHDQLGLAL